MLYVFSVVIIGLPGDDGNIEIYENDHEECFYIVVSCVDNIYTMLTTIVKVECHLSRWLYFEVMTIRYGIIAYPMGYVYM